MKKLSICLLIVFFSSCSSVQLVNNYKNPDIVIFDAYKVLIVGLSQNEEARIAFESRMKKEFDKRGIDNMRSIDLFDVEFTAAEKSEEELDEFEQQLLDKDFDAILFTKVIGSEDRQTLRKRLSKFDKFYDLFKDDYLDHQGAIYEDDYYETFKVINAETSLYCICVGKERQLIWTGNIEITDPKNMNKAIDDYVKLVTVALEEQELIFRKPVEKELTGR